MRLRWTTALLALGLASLVIGLLSAQPTSSRTVDGRAYVSSTSGATWLPWSAGTAAATSTQAPSSSSTNDVRLWVSANSGATWTPWSGSAASLASTVCLDATNQDVCLQRNGAGILQLGNAATATDFARLQFGGSSGSFPALKRTGTTIDFRLADDSTYANARVSSITVNGGLVTAQGLLISNTAPTISSGFGSSPSIVINNGTAGFTINVGTGAAASSGVIGLPTATTGWNCWVNDITAAAAHVAYDTRQTASSTTTATVENQTTSTGAAVPWGVSDILRVSCFAY